MKFFQYFLVIAVLFTVHACTMASLVDVTADTGLPTTLRRDCDKLTNKIKQVSVNCGFKKAQIIITTTSTLAPSKAVVAITLACTKKARGAKIAKRVSRCIKLLTGRCRCLVPERRAECLFNQIVTCAGRNEVRQLH